MDDVISSMLGTFFGAILGIPVGLTVNRIWRDRADVARRKQLRTAILNAVKSNADLVEASRHSGRGRFAEARLPHRDGAVLVWIPHSHRIHRGVECWQVRSDAVHP